jgi:phosphate transport system ATP-binding protein
MKASAAPHPVADPCPAISASAVSISYGAKTALKDVSLDISGGSIMALVGPSGCGKTSFLSCIDRLTDLIESCRVRGRITVGSLEVLSRHADLLTLRRKVGMICQRPNPFPLSIRRNLDLPLREHGMRDPDERAQRIERALHDVGLWLEVKDRLEEPAEALSGGQQQRLCLARALALEPQVMLLDEPCSALDPISSGLVEELIAGLRGRCTIVIVTHNLAQARRIADHVAFFWVDGGSGVLVESGPAAQIFEAPQNLLTAAYMKGLRG